MSNVVSHTVKMKTSGNGDLSGNTGVMFCPSCGAPMPEGMLYCEKCGTEISFVPDFEPEVDDSISTALGNVAEEIASDVAKMTGDDLDIHIRIPKKGMKALAVCVCVAAVITLAVIFIPKVLSLSVFDRDTKAKEETVEVYVEPHEVSLKKPEETNEEPEPEIQVREPYAPKFSLEPGQYEKEAVIEITAPDEGLRVFYTLDGTEPGAGSTSYREPIVLDENGEYTLRAVAADIGGNLSDENAAVYTIVNAGPSDPVILEESGEYTQSTMIVAVMQEGCRITYTTDGSDPTPDSAEYTAPIKMPVGSSVFRFRAFDEDGCESDVTERTYHLVYARLVSEEQAVSSVIRVLIDRGFLLDEAGTIFGGIGYNTYRVESVIEIEGAGEYYRIIESLVSADGSVEDTGLLYAVNTNDGSVHRLGYDSSGHYTLFTLSGR